MDITIETPSSLKDRDELQDIFLEFYTFQADRLFKSGGPKIDPQAPVDGIWNDIHKYFAPHGALTLARAKAGHLVGCGAMTDVGDRIAEFKYLYVRPEARGTGLGRKLVAHRIDIARKMGLQQVRVDTLKSSIEMHTLYESMGFERVPDFPQSKSIRDFAELANHLYFYKLDL